MKKLLITFPFVVLASVVSAQSEKHIEDGTVKNVRVYLFGAQVERTVTTTVDPGMTTLFIEGLSASIDPQSVMVTGSGDAFISGISYQLDYLTNDRKPVEVRKLEDSLKKVEEDLDKASDLEDVYNEEVSLLKANKSVNGANVGVDIDNLREVADFFRGRMIDLKNKLNEVHDQQRQLRDLQVKLTQQLADMDAKTNRPHGTVVVTVTAKQNTRLSLNLSYFTGGASWSPNYEFNATSLTKPVKLAYKADVVQTCNETWENVSLTLSTGNPAIGGQKPILNPWYLRFYHPVPVPVYRGAAKEYESAMPMMASPDVPEGAITTMQQFVTVQDGGTSTDFEIALPYTVRGDGKPVSVEIRKYDLPATFTYYAVPKLDKDAFLLARITGWDKLNLLPGTAKVYFEDNFVGTSNIDPRATTDTLDLSMGRDKRVVVTRQLMNDLTKTKTLGGNTTRESSYEITVRNTKKDAIQLIIEDQMPVSQDNDIKVTPESYEGGEYDEQSGKVTWRLTAAPGVTEKRVIGYSVKYPKDKQLQNF